MTDQLMEAADAEMTKDDIIVSLTDALRVVRDWDLPPSGVFYPNTDGSDSDRPAPYDSVFANGLNGGRSYMQEMAAETLKKTGQT